MAHQTEQFANATGAQCFKNGSSKENIRFEVGSPTLGLGRLQNENYAACAESHQRISPFLSKKTHSNLFCVTISCLLWAFADHCRLAPKIAPIVAYASSDSSTNFYEILGLSESASPEEIKKAYRVLSKQYHPDVNKEPGAQDKFVSLVAAYEVLSDAEERGKYDRLGHEAYERQKGMQDEGDGDGWGFPFNMFGGGQRRPRKSASMRLRLYVSLSQLYFGDILQISFKRPVLCLHIDECAIKRNDCASEAVRVVHQQIGPGFFVQNHVQDDSCIAQGKGWKKNCKHCPHGSTEMETTSLTAQVEPGMRDGDRIEFPKAGMQEIGQEAGDLVLEIRELPNELGLTRDMADLSTTVEITLLEALVGFAKKVPHISGNDVDLARTAVTPDGQVDKLPNQGMPHRSARGAGSLFVKYRVNYPTMLSEDQRKAATMALGDVKTWIKAS